MTDNAGYGAKMSMAVQAVHQMHRDVTKLILLLDKKLGRQSVVVRITNQAKFSATADIWMPEGMHRIYAVPGMAGRVEGITAVFLDIYGEPLHEPLLLVGQAQFALQPADDLKGTLIEGENLWCLWTGYMRWQEARPLSRVQRVAPPVKADETYGKLQWVQVIAVPLYSITGIEDVLHLLERTRVENVAAITG